MSGLDDRVYERLSHDERFRIAIEAVARQDWKEMDRLSDTAGFIEARIHSPGYFERLHGLIDTAMAHGIHLRDLAVAFWATNYWLERTKADDFAEAPEEEQKLAESKAETLVLLVAKMKACNAAWETFCGELAIDPESVGFAYYQLAKEQMEAVGIDIERDADTYDSRLEFLHHRWEHALERARIDKPPKPATNGAHRR